MYRKLFSVGHTLRGTRVAAFAVIAACAFFAACSDLAGPVEKQKSLTVSRDITFTSVDSLHMIAMDTIDAAQLNADFNAMKDRITRVGCASPTVTVVGYAGSDSAIVDTLFLYIGAQSSVPVDTLTGPTFLTPAQLTGAIPQVMWVNSPTLWYAAHLLGNVPYAFALRAYMHATHAITRLALRVEFPLSVGYLN